MIEEKLYKKIIDAFIVSTVDIIFINTQWKILLCLRNNQPLKWIYYFPWWRRYKNESMIYSAIRKSKEEVWLMIDINKLQFLGIYDDIFDNSVFDSVTTHCSTITYTYTLSKKEEQNITIDKQHTRYQFFDITDTSLHDMVKIRINDMKKLSLK